MNFLNSADSRETSPELMEAIFFVAGNDDSAAEKIWESPTDAQFIAIFERVTKDGLLAASDFVWGAAGNRWSYVFAANLP